MKLPAIPYGYRDDPSMPPFDDSQPVIVFDGVCVLCSAFMRFVLKRDHAQQFRFVIAQEPLGQALYRHYGLNPVDFETNLVLVDGRVYTKLAAVAAVLARLGSLWPLLVPMRFIPQPFSDWLYDRVAKNRYRFFGRTEVCLLPTAEIKARFLGA